MNIDGVFYFYFLEKDICRDTIFNDPRMMLGSCVMDPNNMICREWVWKGWILVVGQRLVRIFMGAHTKVDLACIAKPYVDVVQKVWLLGISPSSITFSPFFLPLSFSWPSSLFSPFYTSIYLPFFIYVSVSPCLGAITRPINLHVRVVEKSWIAW